MSSNLVAHPKEYLKGVIMKVCSTCKGRKGLDSFNFKNKVRQTRNSVCKDCMKTYRSNHYANNKKTYLDQKTKRSLKYRLEFYDWLKKQECTDCGEKNFRVLELDHQRDKSYNISERISYTPFKTIMKELEKCEVVCANCHRIRTARQFNYYDFMRT